MNQNFERIQSSRNKNSRSAAELEAVRTRKGKLNKTLRGGRTNWNAMERDEA